MATAYTTSLKLALPTQGELTGTWGDTLNNQVTSMIEEAVAGLKTINTWSTNSATLSTADGSTSESRAAILNLTDTTSDLSGAATLICPAASKVYIVKNATGQAVTVKTASGTGVAIPNGTTGFVYCDGTNVLESLNNVTGNLNVGGNLTVAGNATVTGTTTFNGGTITLGDADTDNVVFGGEVDSNIIPDDDGTYDLGSSSKEWKDIYIDGVAYLDGINFNGTAITSTAAEVNILDGDTSATSTTVADADRVVLNDGGTMKQVAVTDLSAYFDDEITAMPNLVTTAATTVGALNSGSITSGFGTIDTGSSTITTTGLITGGSLDIDDVVINGTTIGHTDDTDLMTLTSGVLTVAGEVDAVSLDISGDADIDGTLEADAITVAGVALSTFIRDTVGTNMISSNTESGITVTYDTSNDNIDFSVDAAQTGITSIKNTSLAIGRDDDNLIKFTTDNEIIFEVSGGDNVTFKASGEIEATSLDISGDADIDGTLEADAITVNGTALSSVIAGTTVANATLSATTTVTDSTANTNFPIVFHDESNGLLDDTGALRYNPSTGELLVPKLTVAGTTTTVDTVTMNAANAIVFEGATADDHETTLSIVDPTADRTINLPNVSGTIPVLAAASNTAITSTPAELNILDGVTSTATELNIVDGDTSVGTTAVAGGDGIVTNDNGTMRQTSLDTFDTYLSATTKTLTNKTLTTPTITTPVVNTGLQLKNGATSSGFIEFFEDSDNGTNKVTLIGPSSTADVTLTLPSVAGTVATTASAADEATALAIALG